MIILKGKEGEVLIDHRIIDMAIRVESTSQDYTKLVTSKTTIVVYNTPLEIKQKITNYEKK